MFRPEPVKEELKAKAKWSVAVLPLVLYDEPTPDTVHWLFESVAVEPGVRAPK